jgi:hypothetical protein
VARGVAPARAPARPEGGGFVHPLDAVATSERLCSFVCGSDICSRHVLVEVAVIEQDGVGGSLGADADNLSGVPSISPTRDLGKLVPVVRRLIHMISVSRQVGDVRYQLSTNSTSTRSPIEYASSSAMGTSAPRMSPAAGLKAQ